MFSMLQYFPLMVVNNGYFCDVQKIGRRFQSGEGVATALWENIWPFHLFQSLFMSLMTCKPRRSSVSVFKANQSSGRGLDVIRRLATHHLWKRLQMTVKPAKTLKASPRDVALTQH